MTKLKEVLFCSAFLALLLLAGSHLQAQITAQALSMSQGVREAIALELPSADPKMVEKLWMDYTKKELSAKTKLDRKTKEYQSLNIDIPGVNAASKQDLYAKVNQKANGSELVVWIASNEGWINPVNLPDQYVAAEKMIMRFALEVSKEQILLEVAAEEKALAALEKELDTLRKDKDKYEKAIEKAKQEIANNEAAIEANIKAQEDQTQAIEMQRQKVEMTKKKGDF